MPRLNTAFKHMSNTTCNNKMFSSIRICRMHEQTKRLYQAAKNLRGVEGQSAIARLLNTSPQTVKNWETRGISKEGMINAQEIIGCSSTWLRDGYGEMKSGIDNVTPGPDIRGKVPVISWVQAGAFCEAIDNLHTGDAYEWIETSVQVREHTFALRVQGDSMEPTFPAGIIVVVEPDMDPLPGDYVIAKNGDEEATFKQLVKDGADWYLKPLNPRYPIKPLVGSRIVGVVRSAEQRFR